MKKTLIIKSNVDSFEKIINSWFEKNNCFVECLNTEKKGICKRCIYIIQILKLKKKYNKRIEKIIVFDDSVFYFYLSIFFSRCYLWLWNTVPDSNIVKKRLKFCNYKRNIYSFDEQDCIKYNFKYNTQFFYKSIRNAENYMHDIYFVGTDKNRYQLLDKIYKYLIYNSINPFFQMVPDDNKQYQNRDILCKQFVEYDEVLKNTSLSKVVLDICKPNQIGMTYRAMEALFYDKKIVTNNTHYRELSFYAPNKIYIITDNSFNGLAEFINSSSIKYDEIIKKRYSISNWLMNFD